MDDAIDHQILMHRDAHFGGSFAIMLAYYEKEGKGVCEEFDIPRIRQLAEYENLVLLTDDEKEEVQRAKDKYAELKHVYDSDAELAKLFADLILSEEDEPQQEMAAIVAKGPFAVHPLIELLTSEEFYNPLFPGYGQAPGLAAQCLGQIGDPRAITPLFESLGQADFFTEEAIITALSRLGKEAKEFLCKVLKKRPITKDNEHAAIALIAFKDDPQISAACLEFLQDEMSHKFPSLSAYLVLGCANLATPEQRAAFQALSSKLPELAPEMQMIMKEWAKVS